MDVFASLARCCTLVLTVAIAACGSTEPDPLPPTVPTSPSTPPPSVGLEVATAFGFAFEHTASGFRPVAGLPLHVLGRRDRKEVTVDVVTDAVGRYEVPGLEREFLQVGVPPQDRYLSPCSVRVWLWNEEPKDVHVVSRTTLLSSGTPPSMPPLTRSRDYRTEALTGVVTERTAQGVTPVAEALVEHYYGNGLSGSPTGFTVTRADGSYVLCGWNDDYGQVVRVAKAGYRTAIQSWGISAKIDFELIRE